MKLTLILFVLFWFGCVCAVSQPEQISSAAVELFEKQVRPIFVEKCQSCHGEVKAQGGLRLTSGSLILKGGSRGSALAPGKPDQSLLIRAVEYRGELKMPPTGKISDIEIERLKRWIAAGAPWPDPVRTAALPQNGTFQITPAQ